MRQGGTPLGEKQRWMRDRYVKIAPPTASTSLAFDERHYAVAEIAAMWQLSPDAARRIFQNEPGVLVLGNDDSVRRKRRYTTLRIPQSVVERVHRRLSNAQHLS